MSTASQSVVLRRRILVRGIVQGVGFRPFVYNLAHKHGLSGYVLNSSSGVTIEVEGAELELDSFLHSLKNHPPSLAHIADLQIANVEVLYEDGFAIRESAHEAGAFGLVSPDIATCHDCWREVLNARDRRYGYPFTNCTNCGPRYTIIKDVPYDRPSTTMAVFQMCADCQAEYDDPGNRRFHAQPNACPVCGPALRLVKTGSPIAEGDRYGHGCLSRSILRDVREVLRQGKIVAIKGLGGFHLACDAENSTAVQALRRRKNRSDKPFAVMSRDLATIKEFCELSAADGSLLSSPEHPIVILKQKPESTIAVEIAPGNSTLGVMLPYTPMQWFLFGEDPGMPPEFTALVMTSGNISEEPVVTSNEEACHKLQKVADWFLVHDRAIHTRVDDSVARTFSGHARLLRRSRGYAPYPIDLGRPSPELLACGAELKNTFCLTKGKYALLSQHIGDVDNFETLEFFQETLQGMKNLFRVQPRAVAYDLHPLYLTSRFALSLPQRKIGVQHHHAHIASCMAENGISGNVIGIAWDGTGYGTDGHIWGGEFLVADFDNFTRRAHFRNVPVPGGDKAVRQPWRSALSYVRDAFGEGCMPDLPLWKKVPAQDLSTVSKMLERGINTVATSSCGRLFDAVAALIGVRHQVTFEGQAAIELESLAENTPEAYPFEISDGDCMEIDFRPTIHAIVAELRTRGTVGGIAARFHNTLINALVETCCRIRSRDRLNRVCLSGGSFQNFYLLERTVERLRQASFEVFLHSRVPPNDGGISLGQAVVANALLQKEG